MAVQIFAVVHLAKANGRRREFLHCFLWPYRRLTFRKDFGQKCDVFPTEPYVKEDVFSHCSCFQFYIFVVFYAFTSSAVFYIISLVNQSVCLLLLLFLSFLSLLYLLHLFI